MQLKKLFKNVVSLTLIQAINYLLPIIIIPFLIKKIGIVNFGLSSYALVLLMPIKVFWDYGFGLSGVKDIAKNKYNTVELGRVISNILYTKIYLIIITTILFCLISLFIPKISNHYLLYFLTIIVVAAQTLVPVWFFQGMEEPKILLIFSGITRVIYILLIYLTITTENDYIYVNFCLGIADLLLSIFCFYNIIKHRKIKISAINYLRFKETLVENISLAKTNFYTMVSLSMPFTILGFVASEKIVGYYSIADKLMQIIRTSAVILYNSVFPRIVHLYETSLLELMSFIKKIFIIIIICYLPIFFFCFFFPELLVKILLNKTSLYPETFLAIKIMAAVPLFAALDIIPSHLLLVTNQKKQYARILLFTCIFSLISSMFLVNNYSYTGASVACLLTEGFTLFLLVKYNANLLKKLLSLKPNESI